MPRAGRPERLQGAGAAPPGGLRLLLVAPPDGAEAWTTALAEAGLEPRVARCAGASDVAAALVDPYDLVLAWDDEEGARAAAVMAAVGGAVPIAVVAHPAAEHGALRALRTGAAAVLERERPARLAVQVGDVLKREWLAARTALSGRIAHDLNNLLAPIPLAVRLLQRADDPGAMQGQLDSVQIATRRSMGAVKELSELLTVDPGGPLRAQAKHLLFLASRAWRDFPGAPTTVLTDYPPDLGAVRVEPVRVLRLLDCLARRAVAGGRGGDPGEGALVFLGRSFEGGAAREGTGVEVRVVWTATAGFAGRRVIDPVRPAEPADGLERVLEVVRDHGWTLSVLDAGAERRGHALLLPGADSGPVGRHGRPSGTGPGRHPEPGDGPPGRSPEPPRSPATGSEPGGRRRRVLVIDCDEEVRRVTRETLEGAGWEVLAAADGTEGVAVYAEHLDSVAAVLVDSHLPYMDGPATIRALRRIGGATLVLTTSGEGDPRRLARDGGGADAVLGKPYDAEALLRALAPGEEPSRR